MSRLTAADFYDPECPQIHIPLDPLLTPQQNAAKYYKEYNKAKTAESILTLQLEKGRRDLDYLNSVLEAIALAEGERDLQEIRQELTDTGYLRRPSKARDPGQAGGLEAHGVPLLLRPAHLGGQEQQPERSAYHQAGI